MLFTVLKVNTPRREVARLRGDRSLNHFPVRIPSLQGTFQALSLALGPYSKVVLRLQEEESMRAQRTELALRGEDSIYIPPVAYESSIASSTCEPYLFTNAHCGLVRSHD